MKTQTKSQMPWWLVGEQVCVFCYQRHPLTLEIRCNVCDRCGCRQCFVLVGAKRVAYCAECHGERR